MITIFTIPKPFVGIYASIQSNAIISWTKLRPRPEIILLGNDSGVKGFCKKAKLKHLPDIRTNEYGTPLVSDYFEKAEKAAKSDVMAYLNTDIILFPDFMSSVKRAVEWKRRFMMAGERLDLDVTEKIKFTAGWREKLLKDAKKRGKPHGFGGVDYFVFTKSLFSGMPDFAVGRPYYDCWMFWKAMSQKVPILDTSSVITCIHQNHERTLSSLGKKVAEEEDNFRTNSEARANFELMGGNYVKVYNILSATHYMDSTTIKPAIRNSYTLRRLEELERKERSAKAQVDLHHRRIENLQEKIRPVQTQIKSLADQINPVRDEIKTIKEGLLIDFSPERMKNIIHEGRSAEGTDNSGRGQTIECPKCEKNKNIKEYSRENSASGNSLYCNECQKVEKSGKRRYFIHEPVLNDEVGHSLKTWNFGVAVSETNDLEYVPYFPDGYHGAYRGVDPAAIIEFFNLPDRTAEANDIILDTGISKVHLPIPEEVETTNIKSYLAFIKSIVKKHEGKSVAFVLKRSDISYGSYKNTISWFKDRFSGSSLRDTYKEHFNDSTINIAVCIRRGELLLLPQRMKTPDIWFKNTLDKVLSALEERTSKAVSIHVYSEGLNNRWWDTSYASQIAVNQKWDKSFNLVTKNNRKMLEHFFNKRFGELKNIYFNERCEPTDLKKTFELDDINVHINGDFFEDLDNLVRADIIIADKNSDLSGLAGLFSSVLTIDKQNFAVSILDKFSENALQASKPSQRAAKKKRILILGDSHVHTFFCIKDPHLDIQICKRQSATAYGLMNPDSQSNAHNFFRGFLKNKKTPNMNHPQEVFFADLKEKKPDYIGVHLGEIDIRSVVFKKDPKNYKDTLMKSVSNLEQFCVKYICPLISKNRIIMLAPHLPKNPEEQWLGKYPECNLKQMTEYALFYCKKLKTMARRNGFKYMDIIGNIYDPKTKTAYEKYLMNLNEKGREDIWHLSLNNTEIAGFWQKELRRLK